jgi:hypothetical protein
VCIPIVGAVKLRPLRGEIIGSSALAVRSLSPSMVRSLPLKEEGRGGCQPHAMACDTGQVNRTNERVILTLAMLAAGAASAQAQTYHHYWRKDGSNFEVAFYPQTKAAFLQFDGKSIRFRSASRQQASASRKTASCSG